jgi:hypothetical protein
MLGPVKSNRTRREDMKKKSKSENWMGAVALAMFQAKVTTWTSEAIWQLLEEKARAFDIRVIEYMPIRIRKDAVSYTRKEYELLKKKNEKSK